MIGACLLDRYRILAELGRGGMGVVYRARDPRLDREVAIKMITPAVRSAEAEQRFRREAQVVARLDHPAIAPIFDFGVHEGKPFLVMPVVAGVSLKALIRERALALSDALEIVAQVADALEYSHGRGVLHRDIKPENILVQVEAGRTLQVRVMDFGLALPDRDERITASGKLFGTPAYFSPERAASTGTEDARSDIYALAIVLYECLAGEPPFVGDSAALLYRIVHEPPQSLRERGVEVDHDLDWIVIGCLAKDPAARLQRAGDLASALRGYLDGLDGVSQRQTIVMPAVPVHLQVTEAHPGRRIDPRRPAVTRMVGRDTELSTIQRSLAAALRGECQLVTIGGEPGIGKTRLLETVANLASARAIRVLHGRFADQERTLPYQGYCELIVDAFRTSAGTSQGAGAGRPDLRDLAPELRARFPMLAEIEELRSPAGGGGVPPPAAAEAPDDRLVLFELLARALARLVAGRPLVLALEGLHNAQAAVEALPYLVRRLGPTPTLIVGTYRSNEVPRRHALRRALAGFDGDPIHAAVRLGPLGAAAHRGMVVDLLGDRVCDELAVKLLEATEGNPFFTQELLRAAVEAGGVARDDSGLWILSGQGLVDGALPKSIQQVVESRLARLPAVERRLLADASVLGRRFSFADLAALTADRLDAEALERALERSIAARLLREETHGREDLLLFVSGVVRDVLYTALPRRRRRRLHRRQAEHLEQRWAGRLERVYPQLLHHFAEGDVPAAAIRYGRHQAEAALAAFLAEDAVRAARTALAFVEDAAGEQPAAVEAELRLLLARSLRAAGSLEAALQEAGEALRLLDRGDRRAAGAAGALLAAEIAWQARKTEATRRLVDKGLGLTDDPGADRAVRRRLLVLSATVANLHGQRQKAQAQLDAAAALAAGERAAAPPPAPGGTLVTALPSPVTNLVPGAHEVIEDIEVIAAVFDTLVRADDEGNLVPGLAASWSASADATAFTFTLRAGVRFSDGVPLDARAVKRGLELAAAAGRGTTMQILAFEQIVGMVPFLAADTPTVAGIEALGARRLRVRLMAPLPIFPALLTDPGTAIARAEGGEWLGTGPFRLAAVEAARVLLARNDNDWRPTPALLDAIELRTDLDAAGIAAGLRSGTLDVARNLLPEDLDAIQRDPRFRAGLVESTRRNVYFILLNRGGPHSRQPAVRRALARVLRVQDLVWRTLGRFAQPAVCLIPPGILGHDPGRRRRPLAAGRAKKLLAAAGVPSPLTLRVAIHPSLLDRYGALTRAIFEQWRSLGVEVQVVSGDLDSYLPFARDSDRVDVLIGRWFADYPDPDNFTYGLLHTRAGHYPRYVGAPEVDRLFERARHETRADVRRALYRQAEQWIVDQDALVPLFHDVDYRIAGPSVRRLGLEAGPPFVRYAEVAKVPAAAAADAAPPAAAYRERGTVRVALAGAVDSLDPVQGLFVTPAEVIPNVFETLARVAEGARVVPHLASALEVEQGGRRLRVTLRGDVRFHDGRRLTVRDVRYSFERLLRSPVAGAELPLLPIRGARAFRAGAVAEIAGLVLHSSHQLTLELESPIAFYPALLANATTAVVPEGCRTFTGSWREGCAGSGPFRLVRIQASEQIELEANPGYWRHGVPRCERLVFELGSPPDEVVADLESGRLSLAGQLPAASLAALRADRALAGGYQEAPRLATYYLACNLRRPALADAARRHALAAALAVVEAVAAGGALVTVASGLIPPGLLGHEGDRRRLAPPPSTASLDGITLSVASHPIYGQRYAPVWERLRGALEAAGVTVEHHPLPAGGMIRLGVDAPYDLFLTRWLADYPDADAFASLIESTDGVVGPLCGAPALDRLIAKGRVETDPALRQAIYRELEQRTVRGARVVPLFYEQVYRVVHPKVTGLQLSGMRAPEVAYEQLARAL